MQWQLKHLGGKRKFGEPNLIDIDAFRRKLTPLVVNGLYDDDDSQYSPNYAEIMKERIQARMNEMRRERLRFSDFEEIILVTDEEIILVSDEEASDDEEENDDEDSVIVLSSDSESEDSVIVLSSDSENSSDEETLITEESESLISEDSDDEWDGQNCTTTQIWKP